MVQVVPAVVQVRSPGVAVAVYPVIAEPPLAPAVHEALMAPFWATSVRADGADGVVLGVAVAVAEAVLTRAAPFVAVTVKL